MKVVRCGQAAADIRQVFRKGSFDKMLFRLSQKLNAKVKAGPMATAPLDSNPYVDWTTRLFTVNRVQYIMITNTPSLYSTVIFGKGVTNDNELIVRVQDGIRGFMEADGLEFYYRQFIAPATGSIRFCKPLNRSVTGSMNEFVAFAKYWLSDGETSPFDVGFRLYEVPMSAIAGRKPETHGFARDVFKRMANAPEA